MVTGAVHFRLLPCLGGESRRQVLTGSANTTPDTNSAAVVCPVCPHPAETHDEIGARYCAATAAGKFDRGCVCVTGTSAR
ncbi:RGCVC family protein [Kutzneria kofuensis]|uniref:Uncharacterized protein n=1 Tax=Kutzneria kofuensis TaxID=103725 RepID=A0A7W9KCD3_9PSEU|nr:RGCVC family protein [Kutzneria kofuensis]MBB5889932.1 hypothetical protein [Kutzneria kofuensis]